jgi:hypothetical protein
VIYVLAAYSLIAKRGLGDKCFQTSFEKIKDKLRKDPSNTQIEAVIIGPKDINGLWSNAINEALNSRHQDITVIYIYQKEEEELLANANNIIRYKIEKPSPDDIEQIVAAEVLCKGSKQKIIDAMFGTEKKDDEPQLMPPQAPAPADLLPEQDENINISEPPDICKSIEEEIAKCSSFKDWDIFKRPFKHELLRNGLINENTMYSEALKLIDNQEHQIVSVFKDTRLSPEEKFNKIKEIGIEKSGHMANANNILVEKFLKTIEEVVSSARLIIDDKLTSIRTSIDRMTKASVMHSEEEKIEQLMLERVDTQMKLLELSREVIEIHKSIDCSAEEIIDKFEEDLPSQNDYINEVMKPFKRYFIPQNSAQLANKILNDLQSEKLVMGHLEAKIMSMVSLLFKLCESDDTIIAYQSKLIRLLSAQKVEDIVIVDTILKNALRLFVGTTDIGRTSTCITLCKILSRRNNCLLIDLTGASKFRDYGIKPVSLDQFMEQRIEHQFLCVEGNAGKIENIDRFVGELKMRLNYYPYINIILDVSQEKEIKQLSESALTISFITNCTNRGIESMKGCIQKYDTENIARKIILIDPQIETSEIVSGLGADMLMYKVITVPYLAQIKACSLKGENPADIEEVSIIFENAFS